MQRLLAAALLGLLLALPASASGSYGGGDSSGPPSAPPPPREPSPPRARPTESYVVEDAAYYIRAKSSGGSLSIADSLAQGRKWQLHLARSLTARRLDDAHYMVQAPFEGTLQGEKGTFPVDLDLYLTGSGKEWRVTDVWIRSSGGRERPRAHTCPIHPSIGTWEAGRHCPIDKKALRP